MKFANRERLQQLLTYTEIEYRNAMKGRVVPNPSAIRLSNKIKELRNQIKDIDCAAAEKLNLSKAPIDDVLEIIALPLLADVMVDMVAGVDGNLRRHGVAQTVFGDYAREIRINALKIVETLSSADETLPRLLDVDDSLVDAVKKKLMSFIKQRLNIKA